MVYNMRCFIAIDLPKDIKEEINSVEKMFGSFSSLKIVKPDNLHLTLKFLGDVEEEKIENIKRILKEIAQNHKQISVFLNKVGLFPNEKYIRVVWIGISNDNDLINIQKEIDNKLETLNFKKEKTFTTHITIARVKGKQEKESLLKVVEQLKAYVGPKFKVDSIHLMKSTLTPEGPIYEELARFELKKS